MQLYALSSTITQLIVTVRTDTQMTLGSFGSAIPTSKCQLLLPNKTNPYCTAGLHNLFDFSAIRPAITNHHHNHNHRASTYHIPKTKVFVLHTSVASHIHTSLSQHDAIVTYPNSRWSTYSNRTTAATTAPLPLVYDAAAFSSDSSWSFGDRK